MHRPPRKVLLCGRFTLQHGSTVWLGNSNTEQTARENRGSFAHMTVPAHLCALVTAFLGAHGFKKHTRNCSTYNRHQRHSLPSTFSSSATALKSLSEPKALPHGVKREVPTKLKGASIDCRDCHHCIFNNNLFLRESTCYITPSVWEYFL